MNTLQLWRYVGFLQGSGLRSDPHRMAMWLHIAHPLTVLALLFLLLPFVFTGHTHKGQRLFFGIIAGIVYSIVVRSFSGFALAYNWPIWVGAFLPLMLVFVIALFMLMRMETLRAACARQ